MKWLHVGCVVLALTYQSSSIGQQVPNQSSAPGASGSAQVERHEPSASAPPAAASGGAQSAQETTATCDKPGDEASKECKDLRAQQDMAKWARLMYIVTSAGIVVSGVVAFLVFLTFRESQKAAKAADKTAAIANATFLATHRPQVRLRSIVVSQDSWRNDRAIAAHAVIVNVGSSAADIHSICFGLMAHKKDRLFDEDPMYAYVEPIQKPCQLQSGVARVCMKITKKLDDREVELVLSDAAAVYCIGEIRYKDGIGAERATAFIRELVMAGPPGEKRTLRCRFVRMKDPDEAYEYEH